MQILYEDNHVLVVQKPAGLPTMGVGSDEKSLLTVVKDYLAEKYQKKGNVYLGVVSRLDTPTTGAVIIARTSKAASRLCAQFREHEVHKIYWAVVEGIFQSDSGTCEHYLQMDKRHRKVFITRVPGPETVRAVLHYQVMKRFSDMTLLEIHLETGRKHQIRVQMKQLGHPILGDIKYGSRYSFPVGIALHARKVAFSHPTLHEIIEITAPLPRSWKKLNLE